MLRSNRRTEDGASLVEFALILPVLMILILGMFSGGIAYNSKISLTGAAREASRFGATLPVSPGCSGGVGALNVDKWLDCVSKAAIGASSGELASDITSRYVCVSFVNPGGTAGSNTGSSHSTKSLIIDGSTTSSSTSDCFSIRGAGSDGLSGKRVQVILGRERELEYFVGGWNLTLDATSVTRYEGV